MVWYITSVDQLELNIFISVSWSIISNGVRFIFCFLLRFLFSSPPLKVCVGAASTIYYSFCHLILGGALYCNVIAAPSPKPQTRQSLLATALVGYNLFLLCTQSACDTSFVSCMVESSEWSENYLYYIYV